MMRIDRGRRGWKEKGRGGEEEGKRREEEGKRMRRGGEEENAISSAHLHGHTRTHTHTCAVGSLVYFTDIRIETEQDKQGYKET